MKKFSDILFKFNINTFFSKSWSDISFFKVSFSAVCNSESICYALISCHDDVDSFRVLPTCTVCDDKFSMIHLINL